jgi:ankyrin repeat protein
MLILLLEKILPDTTVERGSVGWMEQNSVQDMLLCTKDMLGQTLLMWAALGGHSSLIQSLCSAYLPASCSTIAKKDSLGLSLIHFFAIGNSAEGVTRVLNTGCNVNETDSQGWTPLHWAAYFGHEEVPCLL